MGTANSAFMNNVVEQGRLGTDPSTAYFEWSLPEGMDPWAPASWWTFHPALGNTITEDDLSAAARKARKRAKLGEFLRAYANRKTGTANPLVTEEQWAAEHVPDMAAPSTFALSYEVAPGNALSTVTASWRDEHGQPRTRVIRQARGTSWLPGYVLACLEHLPVAVVAADDGGPTRRLTEKLRAEHADRAARGLPVPSLEKLRTLSMPEFGAACMGWLEAARDSGTLGHDGSEALTDAVLAASLRTTNGVSRFSRDEAPRPIAALIGSAVALYAWDTREQATVLQVF